MTAMEWLLAFALAVIGWWLIAAAADTRRGERLAAATGHAVRTLPARAAAWAWAAWYRARIRL